jgi:hypothetical protein
MWYCQALAGVVIIEISCHPGGTAMDENLAKRIVLAFGIGVFLGAVVDDYALGLALAFGLVFGLGLFAAKEKSNDKKK